MPSNAHRMNAAELRKKELQVMAAAQRIGIDMQTEQYLWWIAEFAAQAELPDDWREFETEEGELAYYHPQTKCLSKTHPVLDKFESFIKKQREFAQRNQDTDLVKLSAEQLAGKLGTILDEVMNRFHKGLPPVTPEIVETVALYLSIPTEKEFQLALQIRIALEAYVDRQYQLVRVTKDPTDPMIFLRNIRKGIITRCVLQQEDPLLLCQECEERSAKLKCEQCKDFFCLDCFKMTHATGKRKLHKTQICEQISCDVCDQRRARVEGENSRFCDECYAKKRRDLVGHRMSVIAGLMCSECGTAFDGEAVNDTGESSNDRPEEDLKFGMRKMKRSLPATILCEDCVDLFCYECYTELHRTGRRLHHACLHINGEGQLIRAGELLAPEESQMLIDRARFNAEGGPYVAFRDDQFNTYWYHFRDKIITHQNPYG